MANILHFYFRFLFEVRRLAVLLFVAICVGGYIKADIEGPLDMLARLPYRLGAMLIFGFPTAFLVSAACLHDHLRTLGIA